MLTLNMGTLAETLFSSRAHPKQMSNTLSVQGIDIPTVGGTYHATAGDICSTCTLYKWFKTRTPVPVSRQNDLFPRKPVYNKSAVQALFIIT